MATAIPNGFLTHNLIFFGRSLSRQTVLAKGFLIDWKHLPVGENAEELFYERVRLVLGMLGERFALQYHWWVDDDYSDALGRYEALTDEVFGATPHSLPRWSEFVRRERAAYFNERHKTSTLRRERVALFFTMTSNAVPKWGLSGTREIDSYLRTMAVEFDDKLPLLREIFQGSIITPLDDEGHAAFYYRFLNPSRKDFLFSGQANDSFFHPHLTILENCLQSDGISLSVGHRRNEGMAFSLDGFYHAVFVLREWPVKAWAGMLRGLTGSLWQQAQITQNIFPLPIQKEIKKEQDEARFLQGGISRGQINLQSVIRKKYRKIEALMDGAILPFRVQTLFRIWDSSLEGLRSRCLALQAAINQLQGAKYHQSGHAAQLRHLFFDTFPGWTGNLRRGWDIYADSTYLPYLMPVGGAFGGFPDGGAIYEGEASNLVEIGGFERQTPLHTLVLGMTGSGKSVWLTEYLSQTAGEIGFEGIVDEGESLRTYAELNDLTVAVIQPEGNLTLNYLDTQGSPLTPFHLNMSVGLLMRMLGEDQESPAGKYQAALLGRYLNQLYWDAYEDWAFLQQDENLELQKEAFLIHQLQCSSGGQTVNELRDSLMLEKQNNPDDWFSRVKAIDSDALLQFVHGESTRVLVRNLVFTRFSSSDYHCLNHSSLIELLQSSSLGGDHSESQRLATLLSPWSREGDYGCLFDGFSNCSLGGRGAYFELGRIPESAHSMKEVAAFLVANVLRAKITALPRAKRKRMIFEEFKRFAQSKGGNRVLGEFLEQMRKFGCQTILTAQQFEQLERCSLGGVASQNCRCFVLFRQNGREDLDRLGDLIGLPSEAREEILNYPTPGSPRHGGVSKAYVFYPAGNEPIAGSILCRPSRELLYVAESSGEVFDQKKQAFMDASSPFEAVLNATKEKS